MSKRFQKQKEDFICEHCDAHVFGSGYTNHCRRCLWSKHVDINPGDRASECGGYMPPMGIGMADGEYILLHKCEKCGFERKNKVAENDDFDAVLAISKNNSFWYHCFNASKQK